MNREDYNSFLNRYLTENDHYKKEAIFKEYLIKLEHAFKSDTAKYLLDASSSISVWFGKGCKDNELWSWLKDWLIKIEDLKKQAAISVGCTDLIPETPINAKMLKRLFSLLSEPNAYWVVLSAYENRESLFYKHFEFCHKIEAVDELQVALNGLIE